jgi:hypothetical protein
MENFFIGSNIMVKRIFMQMTTCNNVFICIQRGLDQLEAGWNTLKVVNPINCQFCFEWKFGERITRRSCHSESAISGWRGQIASERHSFSYCTRESSDRYFQQSITVIFCGLLLINRQLSASISKKLF